MSQKTNVLLPIFVCVVAFVSCTQAEGAGRSGSEFFPGEERLTILESNPDEHPVIVMRLLKFKDGAGLERYQEYLAAYLPLLRGLGGEFLFLGSAVPYELNYESSHELFGLKENPWDLLVFERFRSREDLRTLGDMEACRKAESGLGAHLEDVAIHALNGTMRGGVRSSADTAVAPEYPDGDEIFEINLLRFKPNGGEDMYYRDYAKEVIPMIRDGGARVIYGLKAELMLVGEEQYDRVVLVMYPSEEAFNQMVMSEAYQAISPYREDALEVGHLFGFKNAGRVLMQLREID